MIYVATSLIRVHNEVVGSTRKGSEMTTPKDYRVTVKVRNNRILKAIEDVGGAPGQMWCKANGLRYSSINDLINLTESPMQKNGALTTQAEALCLAVRKIPEELWSEEQLIPLDRNTSEAEMSHEQVVAMLPRSEPSYLQDFSAVEKKESAQIMSDILDTLSKREAQVLRMRYYHDMALDEVALSFGVTSSRILQIENKALRKLRHPDRTRKMAGVSDNEAIERTIQSIS